MVKFKLKVGCSLTRFSLMFYFYTSENVRKPLVF